MLHHINGTTSSFCKKVFSFFSAKKFISVLSNHLSISRKVFKQFSSLLCNVFNLGISHLEGRLASKSVLLGSSTLKIVRALSVSAFSDNTFSECGCGVHKQLRGRPEFAAFADVVRVDILPVGRVNHIRNASRNFKDRHNGRRCLSFSCITSVVHRESFVTASLGNHRLTLRNFKSRNNLTIAKRFSACTSGNRLVCQFKYFPDKVFSRHFHFRVFKELLEVVLVFNNARKFSERVRKPVHCFTSVVKCRLILREELLLKECNLFSNRSSNERLKQVSLRNSYSSFCSVLILDFFGAKSLRHRLDKRVDLLRVDSLAFNELGKKRGDSTTNLRVTERLGFIARDKQECQRLARLDSLLSD